MSSNAERQGGLVGPCHDKMTEMHMFDCLPVAVRRALAYANRSYAPSRAAVLLDKGRSPDEIVALIARNDALRLKPAGK